MSLQRPSMTAPPTTQPEANSALQRLVNREEVLQIGYWYRGEGFGEVFDAAGLAVFLQCTPETVAAAFAELVEQGSLEFVTGSTCRFTEHGRHQAARLFSDGFADYTKPAHGECVAGCCEDGDHSQCGDECALH